MNQSKKIMRYSCVFRASLCALILTILVFFKALIGVAHAQHSFIDQLSSMTSSASGAQTIFEVRMNGNQEYATIWVAPSINIPNYQQYYSPFVPVVRSITEAGAAVTYQSQGYRYFTAAFSTSGLYRLRIISDGDAAGAVYVGSGSVLPYDPSSPLTNLVAFAEDNNDPSNSNRSFVDPHNIYYNQSSSSCTYVQFLVWEWGG